MVHDPADLERRLEAGEWLTPGQVAAVLQIGRTTVHAMLRAKTIGHRKKPGLGQYRICNPADVKRLLAESRAETRAEPDESAE